MMSGRSKLLEVEVNKYVTDNRYLFSNCEHEFKV